jgi:biotin synthase-related radical SAM superfamily protein
VLISGGIPKFKHSKYLRDVYQEIISSFPNVHIDIMMIPDANLIDIEALKNIGLYELSVNIEIFNNDIARRLMPQKHRLGRDTYLKFIERAANTFGVNRVRSMLLVGLEPIEDTLAGVEAIARRGGIPVLSPFRPDPSTPLRDFPVLSAKFMEEVFLKASEIVARHGTKLGPRCIPCTHNTLTLGDKSDFYHHHGHPKLI